MNFATLLLEKAKKCNTKDIIIKQLDCNASQTTNEHKYNDLRCVKRLVNISLRLMVFFVLASTSTTSTLECMEGNLI